MTTELTQGFINALRSGLMDGDLLLIETVLLERNRLIRPQAITNQFMSATGGYAPGQRVVTTDRISPSYLRKRPGQLIRFKQKRWAFKPDDPGPWGRFLHPDGTTALLPSQFEREP